jgi:hypothetical protein
MTVVTFGPIFDREGVEIAEEAWAASGLMLNISNPKGRDTARGVTVLATVDRPKARWTLIRQRLLTWGSGLLGHAGAETIDIPAGVTRSLGLIYMGDGAWILHRHYSPHTPTPGDHETASQS